MTNKQIAERLAEFALTQYRYIHWNGFYYKTRDGVDIASDEWNPADNDNPRALYQMSLVEAEIARRGNRWEFKFDDALAGLLGVTLMVRCHRKFRKATANQRAMAAIKVIEELGL